MIELHIGNDWMRFTSTKKLPLTYRFAQYRSGVDQLFMVNDLLYDTHQRVLSTYWVMFTDGTMYAVSSIEVPWYD